MVYGCAAVSYLNTLCACRKTLRVDGASPFVKSIEVVLALASQVSWGCHIIVRTEPRGATTAHGKAHRYYQ